MGKIFEMQKQIYRVGETQKSFQIIKYFSVGTDKVMEKETSKHHCAKKEKEKTITHISL